MMMKTCNLSNLIRKKDSEKNYIYQRSLYNYIVSDEFHLIR